MLPKPSKRKEAKVNRKFLCTIIVLILLPFGLKSQTVEREQSTTKVETPAQTTNSMSEVSKASGKLRQRLTAATIITIVFLGFFTEFIVWKGEKKAKEEKSLSIPATFAKKAEPVGEKNGGLEVLTDPDIPTLKEFCERHRVLGTTIRITLQKEGVTVLCEAKIISGKCCGCR